MSEFRHDGKHPGRMILRLRTSCRIPEFAPIILIKCRVAFYSISPTPRSADSCVRAVGCLPGRYAQSWSIGVASTEVVAPEIQNCDGSFSHRDRIVDALSAGDRRRYWGGHELTTDFTDSNRS